MAVSLLLFFFFFLRVFVDGKCLDDQKKLLLDLKSEFKINSSESINNYLGKWNQTDDCCQWGGVQCDATGRVIKLILVFEGISGGLGESSSLFRFTHLSELDLSDNDFTGTHIPRSVHRLTNLRYLRFSNTGFMGPIPPTLANMTELLHLDLFGNFLTAPIPSFHLCSKLQVIDLSTNGLKGSLSDLHFQGLTSLSRLDLSYNSLNGTIPHHLFALPSIEYLYLTRNQFSGQIKEFPIVNVSKFDMIDLSNNMIEGPIPDSFFQLQGLSVAMLSNNLFNGTFQLHNFLSLPRLEYLNLSNNNLSVEVTNMNSSSDEFPHLTELLLSKCNLYDFPDLRKQSRLSKLDLSNNHIGGDIPSWIWETQLEQLNLSLNLLTDLQKPYHIPASLYILDLHSNQLRCEFPLLPQATKFDGYSNYILLANNSLTGVIPTSICNASHQIAVLDLSLNNLSGAIPPCLLEKYDVLKVLSLRGNNISGAIPDHFSSDCRLKTFDVSNNNLGGKIPKSLANCKHLKVMNVGKNDFDDSFPCMLPLSLHILMLRSNRFHGDLTCQKSWPNLQILDISSNNFSGFLEPLNFSSWNGMMLQSPAHLGLNRSNSTFLSPSDYYRDEVTITVKKVEVKLVKIWPDFTSIDLSCNNFEGEIPDAIGNLTSLYLLNLSHNALTSAIPKSLGALMGLGSLDLSANQLTGRIPDELAKLTPLSILNVSHNHLTGKIPTGPQFQTFQADSFEGNTGLCGFPLNKSCSKPPRGRGVTPAKSKDEEIEWEYVFAALGYVVGLASIAWTLLLCRSFRERYFEKIDEVVDKIYDQRDRRRRHEKRRIRRRRVERRNEVGRQ